jgi:hypothetical protein
MLLTGVPRVHFYEGGEESPEDITFSSCLASVVRFLGQDYPWLTKQDGEKTWRDNYAYIYITAHSGLAFGLRWRDGWHMDNVDNTYAARREEVLDRAFRAVGYRYRLLEKTGSMSEEEQALRMIKESIVNGLPILAVGVFGPPEFCLITGYDESGKVVRGWNFFQNISPFSADLGYEPTGEFRKSDWFIGTEALLMIGKRTERPDVHELDRHTLRFALDMARTPELYGSHTGYAAYEAWARQITDEADFVGQDEENLLTRHEAHNNLVGALAEARWYGAQWLRHIASDEPTMAQDLLAAAECFEREHDLMWEVWGAVGGNGHPNAWREFAKPEVRARIAALILEALGEDRRAGEHFENALGRK